MYRTTLISLVILTLLLACLTQSVLSQIGAESPPEDPPQVVIVSVDNANLRSGPGMEYHIIGRGKRGDSFTFRDRARDWYRVNYQGQNAWIHQSAITEGTVRVLSVKEVCTVHSPPALPDVSTGLLALAPGVDEAIGSLDPYQLAPYVLCELHDGDLVEVEMRSQTMAIVRVRSAGHHRTALTCDAGTEGLLLYVQLLTNCTRRGSDEAPPHRNRGSTSTW